MTTIQTKLAEEKAKLEAINAEREIAWQAYQSLADHPELKRTHDAWLKLYGETASIEMRIKVLTEMEAQNK
jgi:hypothetical protein